MKTSNRILRCLWLGMALFLVLAGQPGFARDGSPAGAPAAAGQAGSPVVKVNIFAVMSPEIEAAAKVCSQDLLVQEQLNTYPQQGFQIHCTLYMTNYPPEQVGRLKELVASMARTVKPFAVSTSGMFVTKENWFFLNLEKGRSLQTLADAVVQAASPLRSPTLYIPEWAKDNPEKLENIKQYGSPNVFSQFEPHLTLLANADGAALARFVGKNGTNPAYGKPVAGRVIGIGLGEADGKGQMPKTLGIFPFPK